MKIFSNVSFSTLPLSSSREGPYIKLGIALIVSIVACTIFRDYPEICVPLLCLICMSTLGMHYRSLLQHRVCSKIETVSSSPPMDALNGVIRASIHTPVLAPIIQHLFQKMFAENITGIDINRYQRGISVILHFSHSFEILSDDPKEKLLIIPKTVIFRLFNDGLVFEKMNAPFEYREKLLLWKIQETWERIQFANGVLFFHLRPKYGLIFPWISRKTYERELVLGQYPDVEVG